MDVYRMSPDDDYEIDDPTDLKYVGPKTASLLEEAGIDAAAIVEKTVSYDGLIEAGVNFGVAGKLRREHSLSWSFGPADGDGLTRRSNTVSGLSDGERAWVAASAGDWETDSANTAESAAETDGSGEAVAAEAAWRERSRPTPITSLETVSADLATRLGDAGITSVRSLATANPERVADALEMEIQTIERLCETARNAQ